MATEKKISVKKKTVVAKKAITKKKAKPTTGLIGASPVYKTFKLSKDIQFFNLRVTKQTIYWSILLITILLAQLWILNTQLDVLQAIQSIGR